MTRLLELHLKPESLVTFHEEGAPTEGFQLSMHRYNNFKIFVDRELFFDAPKRGFTNQLFEFIKSLQPNLPAEGLKLNRDTLVTINPIRPGRTHLVATDYYLSQAMDYTDALRYKTYMRALVEALIDNDFLNKKEA